MGSADSESVPIHLITGVVLAGGRATRMDGQDKGLLMLGDRAMIQLISEALQPQVANVLINANRNQARYAELTDFPVVPDVDRNFAGPLAGIAAALAYSESPYLVAVPCDSPFLAHDLVSRLYTALCKQDAEIAMATCVGRPQPVFVLLLRQLLPSLKAFLASGEHKIIHWYHRHRVVEVNFDDRQRMFENINTPQDRLRLERELECNP